MSYPYLRVKGLVEEISDIAELNRIVMYAKSRISRIQEESEWGNEND